MSHTKVKFSLLLVVEVEMIQHLLLAMEVVWKEVVAQREEEEHQFPQVEHKLLEEQLEDTIHVHIMVKQVLAKVALEQTGLTLTGISVAMAVVAGMAAALVLHMVLEEEAQAIMAVLITEVLSLETTPANHSPTAQQP